MRLTQASDDDGGDIEICSEIGDVFECDSGVVSEGCVFVDSVNEVEG